MTFPRRHPWRRARVVPWAVSFAFRLFSQGYISIPNHRDSGRAPAKSPRPVSGSGLLALCAGRTPFEPCGR